MARLTEKIDLFITEHQDDEMEDLREALELLDSALYEIERLQEYEWMYKDLAE